MSDKWASLFPEKGHVEVAPATSRWSSLFPQEQLDIAACREMLRVGSQSFYAASMILPRDVRLPASVLYAFCRIADDAVDKDGGTSAAVADLRARLAEIYGGTPRDSAADRAMVAVVTEYGIPKTLLEALIEGFEWDVAGRRYATLAELYDYAARVAGTVGAMMAMVMGVRAPDVLARACDLGVAMQLTNIARDVGEDARAGRLYLPLNRLAAAGLDAEAWLRAPEYCEPLGAVVQQLLDAADELYARARVGIAQLPAGARPGILAASCIYAEIGRVIERRGLDSVSSRAVVPRSRKLTLLSKAMIDASRPLDRDFAPPLQQVRFLVDAAAGAAVPG
ncbi:MAG: phytoene/squalene synthase family protein [Pseudomonadota bacterium]